MDTRFSLPREARRRGLSINHVVLRKLWRIGLVAPFLRVNDRKCAPIVTLDGPEPELHGSHRADLVQAGALGRLFDPGLTGYKSQYRFDRTRRGEDIDSLSGVNWWNGFLYSRWQLLQMRSAASLIATIQEPGSHPPKLASWHRDQAVSDRQISLLLVALEGRYSPEVSRDHLAVRSDLVDQWRDIRTRFNAEEVLHQVGWSPDELPRVSDTLLRKARAISPLGNGWMDLLKQANAKAWDGLSGDALLALDYLRAAEIVSRCSEDLRAGSMAHGLEQQVATSPLRLSARPTTLNNSLARLGLSPHPRVILVLEGETEAYLASKVRAELNISPDERWLRILTMRGEQRDLTMVASLASAPVISKEDSKQGLLEMSRPPTYVLIAVDSDSKFADPTAIARLERTLITELDLAIQEQGFLARTDQLEELISVRSWAGGTFEFSHFSDDELLAAIETVRPTDPAVGIRMGLANLRATRGDIKRLWKKGSQPSKVRLASELWPQLRARIADDDLPLPEIAEAILDAYWLGRRVGDGAYWIKGSAK